MKEINPKYFLLENVRMKEESENIISKNLDTIPIAINSSLVSAQNRYRLYWTNIPNVVAPQDKKIMLQDIIDYNCTDFYLNPIKNNDEKIFFNEKNDVFTFKLKSQTILSTIYKENEKSMLKRNKLGLLVGKYNRKIGLSIKNNMEKSLCLNASDWRGLNRNQTQVAIFNPSDGLIRKLTPIECERLQTIPDNYTNCISKTQRYKSLGNGWTVDVIAHIFSFLPKYMFNK